jgi:UDP-glucuronate 4-epimerase
MNILVTGCAGFIGFHTCLLLIKKGYNVIGIDNLNSYYSVKLKKDRLKEIYKISKIKKKQFIFLKKDICSYGALKNVFSKYKFKYVINLAAQAGVRFSISNPKEYLKTNINGFFNILDLSKKFKIKHLVYASTSSVYGANENFPLSEKNIADHPIQFYAATKRSNEIMAHSYSSLYNLPCTGLRFFTVYGPWGRPDMALYLFTKNIIQNKKVPLFNKGNHQRSFTYIDDIVAGIYKSLKNIPKRNKKWSSKRPDPSYSYSPYRILNIGNNKSESLKKYLFYIEKNLNKKAKIKNLKIQQGDIVKTEADLKKIIKEIGYRPNTSIEEGVKRFIRWYKTYHKIK